MTADEKKLGLPVPDSPPPAEAMETGPLLGYGHRAHSPDPMATYSFEPGAPRLLASDKRKRWTVPG